MKAAIVALAKRLGLPPGELVEYWSERAAMREYEGGLARADAEDAAFEDVRAKFDDIASDKLLAGDRRGPRAASVTPTTVELDDADER